MTTSTALLGPRPSPRAPFGSRARRGPGALLAALALVLAAAAPAAAQPLQRRPGAPQDDAAAQRLLDLLGPDHFVREAWRAVVRRPWDAKAIDRAKFEAARAEAVAAAQASRTPREVRAAINAMLGTLGVSHLAVLERAVWERELAQEFVARRTLRFGCELIELDGRLFLDGVAHDGPAARAGLRAGDEVATIEGAPALGSPWLDPAAHDPGMPGPPGHFLRPDGERPLTLGVRRAADGPLEGVSVTPFPTSLVDAARASVRVERVGDAKVGVVRLWHFMHMDVARTVARALEGPFVGADAVVLDLRGRGGSSAVVEAVLALFVGRRARWRGPVVCLTDAGTRSAKEIFAWRWRQAGRGPIVGERTQGACIGCVFQELSDGSIIMLPVQDVRRMTGGESLEGKGVDPTHPVAQLPLPYRAGRDAILDAGLAEAARLAEAATLEVH